MNNKSPKSNSLLLTLISLVILVIFSIAVGILGFMFGNSLQSAMSNSNLDLSSLSVKCINQGGEWLGKTTECEGVSEPFCRSQGGNFNACASPCRNSSGDTMCIQMCLQVCKFK